MANRNDMVRPVRHPRPDLNGDPDLLRYSWNTRLITMQPVSLDELSLSDFKHIHNFFRKLERIKGETGVNQV